MGSSVQIRSSKWRLYARLDWQLKRSGLVLGLRACFFVYGVELSTFWEFFSGSCALNQLFVDLLFRNSISLIPFLDWFCSPVLGSWVDKAGWC
ncbi:hypothetical protein OPV22_034065 [Ensete ventricosum]|uniref:Uncharacterized protein n=1 Tax=Ensete ventricosum TaxID=4639 RepID=A0AAV8PNW5_ENSVE|nr:hypothetical protein OPV22_034065 [Ensete ventricosum]